MKHPAMSRSKRTQAPTKLHQHRSAALLDLRRFKPMVVNARTKVDELLARNAQLVSVHENQVCLQRLVASSVQVATVDQWGRVSWVAA